MSKAYINVFLDNCLAYGFAGGPVFSTQIVEMQNGRERRNAKWAEAKHKYSGNYNNLRKEQYENIKKIHLITKGSLSALKFIDPLDNELRDEIIAVGDNTTKEFQVIKNYSLAGTGLNYARSIFGLVVEDDFKVTINNIVQNPGSYSIKINQGKIVFNTAPLSGGVIRVTGKFFVWVRFVEDELLFSLDNINATNASINLIEVAPPPDGYVF